MFDKSRIYDVIAGLHASILIRLEARQFHIAALLKQYQSLQGCPFVCLCLTLINCDLFCEYRRIKMLTTDAVLSS